MGKQKLLLVVAACLLFVFLYVYVFAWRAPDGFPMADDLHVDYPLLSWAEYAKIAREISPPVIKRLDDYQAGAFLLFGAEHRNDPAHPQFDALRTQWNDFNPTVALIEGRLGFLLPPLMDPIKNYGESGLVTQLARKKGIPVYSWEFSKSDETNGLLREHTKDQVAMFLILRPFLGRADRMQSKDADRQVAGLIKERGGLTGISGAIGTLGDLERIWVRDFANETNWRELKFGPGLPGYLGELFERSNDLRDEHLLSIVDRLTQRGERVFVSCGWSHVVRIEAALPN